MTQQLNELIEVFRAEAHAKTPDPSRLVALLEGDLLHLEQLELLEHLSRCERYTQLLAHRVHNTCACRAAEASHYSSSSLPNAPSRC